MKSFVRLVPASKINTNIHSATKLSGNTLITSSFLIDDNFGSTMAMPVHHTWYHTCLVVRTRSFVSQQHKGPTTQPDNDDPLSNPIDRS